MVNHNRNPRYYGNNKVNTSNKRRPETFQERIDARTRERQCNPRYYNTQNINTKNRGTSGIYKITNDRTGETYIGQSKNIEKRIKSHENELRQGTHHNKGMQADWRRGDGFTYTILEKTSPNRQILNQREEAYIAKHDSFYHGYNQTPGGKYDKYKGYYDYGGGRLENYEQPSYHYEDPTKNAGNYNQGWERPKRNTRSSYSYETDHTRNPRYYGDRRVHTYPPVYNPNYKLPKDSNNLNTEKTVHRKNKANKKKETPWYLKYEKGNWMRCPKCGNMISEIAYGVHKKCPHCSHKIKTFEKTNFEEIKNGMEKKWKKPNIDPTWIECPECGTLNHKNWVRKYKKCHNCSCKMSPITLSLMKKEKPSKKLDESNEMKENVTHNKSNQPKIDYVKAQFYNAFMGEDNNKIQYKKEKEELAINKTHSDEEFNKSVDKYAVIIFLIIIFIIFFIINVLLNL